MYQFIILFVCKFDRLTMPQNGVPMGISEPSTQVQEELDLDPPIQTLEETPKPAKNYNKLQKCEQKESCK